MDNDDASSQNEKFLREFIGVYRKNRLLWDQKHPLNKKREERAVALEELLSKCKEYHSEADADFVTYKIKTLRTIFRKEYRKVLESRKIAYNPEDTYKPSLWYYNLLLFIVGEENNEKYTKQCRRNTEFSMKVSCWNRDYTVLLIDLFKKHPVLYKCSSKQYSKAKCRESVCKITNDLSRMTGKKFKYADVAKKIHMLKYQYKRCYIQMDKSDPSGSSKLWCFDLLNFLKDHIDSYESKKKASLKSEKKTCSEDSNSDDDYNEDDNIPLSVLKQEGTLEIENNCNNKCPLDGKSDNFKIVGKNVATQLREMSDEQRLYCERLINELMYHGLMENLTNKSKLDFAE